MNSRPVLLLIVLTAVFGAQVAVRGQYRGIAATIVTSAPVTLLPDEGRAPLATLPEGTQVQVLGPSEDGWYRISFQDSYLWGDRIGYVRATHVKVSAPPRETPPSAVKPPAPSPARPSTVSSRGLSQTSISAAIAAGYQQKGVPQGLRVLDTGERWSGQLAVNGSASTTTATVRLQIYTPLTWIQQIASDAARRGRTFTAVNVTDEMTRSVLRVIATGANAATTPLRHIVLRDETRAFVVQPLSKEAFSEHVLNAKGQSAVFDGLRVTFPLEAVRELRGAGDDDEFIIAVIDAAGVETGVKISKAQLQDLPM